ncbi:hypothetical protein BCR36DRAFT_581507 [Piromyces finnis]|uniref:Uncharacterized protein n=1 Tax=Piromyces finnis TaxID=1754191 RepID=A0A1Y1VI86_9FUNG|nr:hypothetical protein BCR36DRAFT_581507 [Piromyces finnis]|eukprot:ORX55501.1 hypothetical protein BCR36DRAFT_581507 [Piromyces finnis]
MKKKEKKIKIKQNRLFQEYSNKKQENDLKNEINGILPYIELNKQLKDVDQGRFTKKSTMELKIDKAISTGNFELADKLNDELIMQQKEKIISESIECKNYIDNKNLEMEKKRKKKRSRLVWGFDSKQRWETKGNM